MISEHTRKAIVALLAVDEGASEAERMAVCRALAGEPDEPAVMTVKEACKRLGKSRQTIHKLVCRGLLKPVRGGGEKGYNTGIATESVRNYIDSLSNYKRSA